MKNLLITISTISLLFAGCGNKENHSDDGTFDGEMFSNRKHAVTVVDKIDAKGYSYLQVSENDNIFWIAVPRMEVEKGEKLYFSQAMEMQDFTSETIDKTFESILFVQDAAKSESGIQMPDPHSTLSSIPKEEINIEPAADGMSLADIFKNAENLKGKTIKVKGKVVKVSQQIMNRNWIHIQDGTQYNGNYDLVVTSDDMAEVGEIITAEGILSKDKDFGSGYVFNFIIEEAKIIK
jgi:hypothetical protein